MPKKPVKYVDGFVLIVPDEKISAYKKIAKECMNVWMEMGALGYKECIGDDLAPINQDCPYLPFPKLTKLKSNETVWFSYIEYESKTHRNKVNKKVNAYFEKKYQDQDPSDVPFDMRKMAFGGFKVAVGNG